MTASLDLERELDYDLNPARLDPAPGAAGELLDAGPSEKGWSRVELITRCPQLASYRFNLGLPLGINAEPLVRGGLGHVVLAHHYRRVLAERRGEDPGRWLSPGDAARVVAARPGGAAGERDHGKDPAYWRSLLPVALAACRAYLAKYGAREPVEILAVEHVLEARIGGHRYTQRADLAIRGPSGKVLILDHKFVGHLDAGTVSRYTLDGQFLGYDLFGRALWGEDFGGVLGNFIGCGKGAAGPFAFRRARPDLAPWAASCHPLAVRDAEERWAALHAEGRDPWLYPKMLNTQVCRGLFGRCPGWELCCWGPDRAEAAAAVTRDGEP